MEQRFDFEGRTFTTSSIANALGVKNDRILYIAKRLGVGQIKILKGQSQVKYYTHAEYVQIKNYLLVNYKKPKPPKEEPKQKMTLEELKKLHPLVTDERCFNLNWWPETKLEFTEDITSW